MSGTFTAAVPRAGLVDRQLATAEYGLLTNW